MSYVLQCVATWALVAGVPAPPTDVVTDVTSVARRAGVPPVLAVAVVQVESAWREDAVSPAGAHGLAQVTWAAAVDAYRHRPRCTQTSPFLTGLGRDHRADLRYGMCYLGWLLEKYEHNPALTLAAYNGGTRQAARLARGAPLAPETADYLVRVLFRIQTCERTD
jgi:soluble lytic murein transglycosylase-like protein